MALPNTLSVHQCAVLTSLVLQIAVVRETDAKGPFCSTVLAVVVVKDVLLFICLAMNLEFANIVSSSWVT